MALGKESLATVIELSKNVAQQYALTNRVSKRAVSVWIFAEPPAGHIPLCRFTIRLPQRNHCDGLNIQRRV